MVSKTYCVTTFQKWSKFAQLQAQRRLRLVSQAAQPTILDISTPRGALRRRIDVGDAQIVKLLEATARGHEKADGLLKNHNDEGCHSDLMRWLSVLAPALPELHIVSCTWFGAGSWYSSHFCVEFEIMRGQTRDGSCAYKIGQPARPARKQITFRCLKAAAARAPQHVTVGPETLPALIYGRHRSANTGRHSRLNAKTAHNATIPAIEREIRGRTETMVRIATDKMACVTRMAHAPPHRGVRPQMPPRHATKPPVIPRDPCGS
jgi:hypothetical protein